MHHKQKLIMSLGAALAALGGPASQASTEPPSAKSGHASDAKMSAVAREQVNQVVNVGGDALGFVVTQNSDGEVVAEHYSHTSHASHASHSSHYSSR